MFQKVIKKLEKLVEDYNKIIKQIETLIEAKEAIIKDGNISSFNLYMRDNNNHIINYNLEDTRHNDEVKFAMLHVVDILIGERNKKLAGLSVEIHDILKNYKVEE